MHVYSRCEWECARQCVWCSIHNCTCVRSYLPVWVCVWVGGWVYLCDCCFVCIQSPQMRVTHCHKPMQGSPSKGPLSIFRNAFLYFFRWCTTVWVNICVWSSVACAKKKDKKQKQNSIKNIWTSNKICTKKRIKKYRNEMYSELVKNECEKMASKHVDSVATWW